MRWSNVDWKKPMQRTYEYQIVDVNTWQDVRPLKFVKTSSIDWDTEADTVGSAAFDMDENIGEHYVRIYMVVNQNGVTSRGEIGTFLVQTPSSSFDGKVKSHSLEAYTSLIELNEKPLPIGYYVKKGENIMDLAFRLAREGARAPVIKTTCDEVLEDDFVADTDDTYLTFIKALISNAKYELTVDERGCILFAPKRDMASLNHVETFNDDNSSILLPEISEEEDIYGIPNVVTVVCSTNNKDVSETGYIEWTVKNEDNSSPTSIQARGREIIHRVVDPELLGDPTSDRVKAYAEQLLKELSSIEKTVTFSHGYCPVKIGDCVLLNYTRAGLHNIKARIISQSIECTPSCTVTETVAYTRKYWR